MGKVRWQDQHAFENAKYKANEHDPANDREEIAHATGYQEYRQESSDGGQHSKHHGCNYFRGTSDSSFPVIFLYSFVTENTFADDNGVIDNDAKYQNESKYGQGTDVDTDKGEHPDCA